MIDLGDPLPIQTMEVRDSIGALANAGSMTLTVYLPDGTSTSGSFSNPSTGLYVPSTYITTQVGRYIVRWVGTGLNSATYTEAFDVRPALSNAIVSMQQARDQLNLTSSDEELRLFIESATEEIEARCGAVAARTVTDTVYACRGRLVLSTRPVLSVTSATVSGSAQDISGWRVPSAMSGIVELGAWPYWGYGQSFPSAPYVVTYTAGRSPIPASLIAAALLRVQHSYETQRGPAELPLADAAEGGGSAFLLLLRARDKEGPYLLPSVA